MQDCIKRIFSFGVVFFIYNLTLTLGYGDESVEIPLANADIVITKPDGTLWQKTKTDENGMLTWYVNIGDTYFVYADGELFLEIVA